jgi:hypothetical protein
MDAARFAAVALALPGVLVAIGTAVALGRTALDEPPMWPRREVNLAEAAATRDEAEVVRLVEGGADPDVRYPIGRGFVAGGPTELTPLEASVANDDPAMLEQLLQHGAAFDAATWNRLRCIAEGEGVIAELDRRRPPDTDLHCAGVVRPWESD